MDTPSPAVEPSEPKPAGWPNVTVLLSGIVTSVLTLFLIYLASQRWPEFQPMGFYLNLVIPIGALLVGIVAGSGYGIASWYTGAKVGGFAMLAILILQVWAYFAAQHQEYRAAVAEQERLIAAMPEDLRAQLEGAGGELVTPGFWQYFDGMTRSFCFTDDEGEPGEPFGAWGYLIRFAEILGFSLGGFVAPALLMALPYCEACGVYMESKQLGHLPAGIEPRKIKKKETEAMAAYEEEVADALTEGQQVAARLLDDASAGDGSAIREALAQHAPDKKAILKATARTEVHLHRCPRCGGGALLAKMVTGQADKTQVLAEESRTVSADLVREILEVA